jgi:uncharacterized paraquat-inducible protein A
VQETSLSIEFKVEASGLEFDPEKETTDLECPECKAGVTVTFAQIQREETVTCKTCQNAIRLKDEHQSTAKAVSDINKGFGELRRALEDLGH